MKFELELDEKGEIVGTPPAEVDAIFKRIEATAHGAGYGKGVSKAAEDAKKQIEDTVRVEVAKREALLPIEREKWAGIDEENKALKTQLAEHMRESDRTLRKREEVHAEEITKRVETLNKLSAKVRSQVETNLRSLSAQFGARDESVPELVLILKSRIGFDDDMEPFVMNDEGSGAATLHGKPLSIEAFVKGYLDTHPHHRKPTAGAGGGARGGASLRSTLAGAQSLDAARQDYAETRSPQAINAIFEASRKKSA